MKESSSSFLTLQPKLKRLSLSTLDLSPTSSLPISLGTRASRTARRSSTTTVASTTTSITSLTTTVTPVLLDPYSYPLATISVVPNISSSSSLDKLDRLTSVSHSRTPFPKHTMPLFRPRTGRQSQSLSQDQTSITQQSTNQADTSSFLSLDGHSHSEQKQPSQPPSSPSPTTHKSHLPFKHPLPYRPTYLPTTSATSIPFSNSHKFSDILLESRYTVQQFKVASIEDFYPIPITKDDSFFPFTSSKILPAHRRRPRTATGSETGTGQTVNDPRNLNNRGVGVSGRGSGGDRAGPFDSKTSPKSPEPRIVPLDSQPTNQSEQTRTHSEPSTQSEGRTSMRISILPSTPSAQPPQPTSPIKPNPLSEFLTSSSSPLNSTKPCLLSRRPSQSLRRARLERIVSAPVPLLSFEPDGPPNGQHHHSHQPQPLQPHSLTSDSELDPVEALEMMVAGSFVSQAWRKVTRAGKHGMGPVTENMTLNGTGKVLLSSSSSHSPSGTMIEDQSLNRGPSLSRPPNIPLPPQPYTHESNFRARDAASRLAKLSVPSLLSNAKEARLSSEHKDSSYESGKEPRSSKESEESNEYKSADALRELRDKRESKERSFKGLTSTDSNNIALPNTITKLESPSQPKLRSRPRAIRPTTADSALSTFKSANFRDLNESLSPPPVPPRAIGRGPAPDREWGSGKERKDEEKEMRIGRGEGGGAMEERLQLAASTTDLTTNMNNADEIVGELNKFGKGHKARRSSSLPIHQRPLPPIPQLHATTSPTTTAPLLTSFKGRFIRSKKQSNPTRSFPPDSTLSISPTENEERWATYVLHRTFSEGNHDGDFYISHEQDRDHGHSHNHERDQHDHRSPSPSQHDQPTVSQNRSNGIIGGPFDSRPIPYPKSPFSVTYIIPPAERSKIVSRRPSTSSIESETSHVDRKDSLNGQSWVQERERGSERRPRVKAQSPLSPLPSPCCGVRRNGDDMMESPIVKPTPLRPPPRPPRASLKPGEFKGGPAPLSPNSNVKLREREREGDEDKDGKRESKGPTQFTLPLEVNKIIPSNTTSPQRNLSHSKATPPESSLLLATIGTSPERVPPSPTFGRSRRSEMFKLGRDKGGSSDESRGLTGSSDEGWFSDEDYDRNVGFKSRFENDGSHNFVDLGF